MAELRAKIEKEFDENPLLKNLGVTIYGSAYEARNRATAEQHKKVSRVRVWVMSVKVSRTGEEG